MGDCLFMRKGAIHMAPLVLKPAFADNTWEDIAKACQWNRVPNTWAVGDQMSMTINGVAYMVDIIGKSHDDYADGSGKAPLTFQLHDCYETAYTMNNTATNTGGWESCAMRNTHLPAIFALMPLVVRSAIKGVNKLSNAGDLSNITTTTVDYLFLLAEIEVFGAREYSASGEGAQYEYYVTNSKVKKLNGSNGKWWLRSPSGYIRTNNCSVTETGARNHIYSDNVLGVSFAFCF